MQRMGVVRVETLRGIDGPADPSLATPLVWPLSAKLGLLTMAHVASNGRQRPIGMSERRQGTFAAFH
jgi:hypothetical protein